MADIMTRAKFTYLWQPGLDEIVRDVIGLAEYQYPKLFKIKSSKRKLEEDYGMTGMGRMTSKTEGGLPTILTKEAGYYKQYTNLTYANYVEITEEAVEDDLYDQLTDLAAELANSAKETKEYNHMVLFNYCDATTYYAGGDALALMSDSHLWSAASAQTYDTSAGATAISATNLEAALVVMRNAKNAAGVPVWMNPKRIWSSISLQGAIHRILNSTLLPGGSQNDVNPIKALYNLEPICSPYITSATKWGLQAEQHWLKSYNRKAFGTRAETAEGTGNLRWYGRERYVLGFNVAAGNYISTGA